MLARQKLAILLLIVGLFLSASPLLVNLGTLGLVTPECLETDLASGECIKYGGNLLWVIYSTFVTVGQKYMFFIIPIGIILILSAFIISFIQAPKYNYYK